MIHEILSEMGYPCPFEASAFHSEEDGEAYAVWKITMEGRDYVLKEAKGSELEICTTFWSRENRFAPRLYGSAHYGDKDYFLMEYIPGRDLSRCDRAGLTLALDALIDAQEAYWEKPEFSSVGQSFDKSMARQIDRGQYLKDPELELAYGVYLKLYPQLPRTLCHDDLLPFNVLVSDSRAVLIDWEQAGMLPYPTPLARLLAHGEEDESAFFYMRGEDKAFAIDYYYDRLLRDKGIGYGEYRETLDCFFLFEYCEWVMLGNKYGDTASDRFRHYLRLAKRQAAKINGK